jgi:hypothetical protein
MGGIKGRFRQLDFSGFDLGVIEDLIDDEQEAVPAVQDVIEVLPLLGVQWGLFQHAHEAEDRV